MKKIIAFFSAVVLILTTSFIGTNACDENDFFHPGVKSKLGYYTGEGKKTGESSSEVVRVYTSGDSTIAVIKSTFPNSDEKKPPRIVEVKYICVNGELIMDMGGVLNSATTTPSGHDMKMVLTGNMVAYKSSYIAGEILGDINMVMETWSDGKLVTTSTILTNNRKVEAVEDLKVPAGTFKCYKISSTTSSTMKFGTMTIPGMKDHVSVMYYSPKAGMVRMEEYSEGKITSYTELIELTK